MGVRSRAGALAVSWVLAVLAAPGALRLAAQEPSPGKPAEPPARRAYDPTRRVPSFFGQIGLTSEQKERMYKIRGRHLQKIEALEKQIADARSEMMAECEALLTDGQKQLLEVRRRASAEGRKAKAAAAEPPAAKPAEKTSG